MKELNDFLDIFASGKAISGIFSDSRNSEKSYKKGKITLMYIGGESKYQIELFTTTQSFHYNYSILEVKEFLDELLHKEFRQFAFSDDSYDYSVKFTKKEKLLSNRKLRKSSAETAIKNHNREKEYLIKEGVMIPALYDLGIFSAEGKVINSMYDKYRQINRFIEFIEDMIKTSPPTALNIIDFGCGKSYLTFIVYHYLNFIKKIPTRIVGMDLKEQVISDCNALAKKYNYENLVFHHGDIADYKDSEKVDMVITLHACDTATDYALYHAVKLSAEMIISVPCCQHEINSAIKGDVNTIFTRYGLIKERMSALATDSIRANLLEICGYNTQVLEFVDFAHSPKNIMIRAKRGKKKNDTSNLLTEIEEFCSEYKVEQTLKKLLTDDGII